MDTPIDKATLQDALTALERESTGLRSGFRQLIEFRDDIAWIVMPEDLLDRRIVLNALSSSIKIIDELLARISLFVEGSKMMGLPRDMQDRAPRPRLFSDPASLGGVEV